MKKLCLEDKAFIDSFYEKAQIEMGYDSFAGEISVSHGHKNKVYYEVLDGSLFYIEENHEDGEKSIVPVFLNPESRKYLQLLPEYMKDNSITSMIYTDYSFVNSLRSILNLEPDSDSEHEAIYPIERFRNFEEIDSQRRQANIFFRSNPYEFSSYDKSNICSIIKLANQWETESSHPTEGCDTRITEFLTENFDFLGIRGYSLQIEGDVAAYAFGEKIKNDTFVIYNIKAKREYKGIYQAFLNLMCNHTSFKDINLINNTNLTDVEGLRESKLRLKPKKMIVPWFGELK